MLNSQRSKSQFIQNFRIILQSIRKGLKNLMFFLHLEDRSNNCMHSQNSLDLPTILRIRSISNRILSNHDLMCSIF
jgi:hypothetical protein